MSKKVVMTRTRTVEEKIETTVSTENANDAIAACQHLVDGEVVDWKYNRTVDIGLPSVIIKEIKS